MKQSNTFLGITLIKISNIIIIISIFFCLIFKTTSTENSYYETNRKLLKKYAYCYCLTKSLYKQVSEDEDKSITKIYEDLDYNWNAIFTINEIVSKIIIVASDKIIIEGTFYNMVYFRCLKLYESTI